MLQAIANRRDENRRFDAAIHGIKLESAALAPNRVELSKKDQEAVEKHAALAIARKQKELASRG